MLMAADGQARRRPTLRTARQRAAAPLIERRRLSQLQASGASFYQAIRARYRLMPDYSN